MEWHYRCPACNTWGFVAWEDRDKRFSCHHCKRSHSPPSPATQHQAYVDTHNWPVEMEDVVLELKGSACTVPGCTKNAQTLDHRVAYSRGGRTSVENLWPMCNSHNQSKGDQDYWDWLRSLRAARAW